MNVFASSIDCLTKENGLAVVAMQWTEVGRDHIKRKVNRHEFMVNQKKNNNSFPNKKLIFLVCFIFIMQQIKGIILDVLTELCHLNEEEQIAWSKLLSTIYHFLFGGLGDP